MNAFKKLEAGFIKAVTLLCIACAVCLFLILLANVFFRLVPLLSAFPNFSMGWFDEIVQLCTVWMIMLAATILVQQKDHFAVTLLPDKLKGTRAGYWYNAVIGILSLVFYVCLCYYGCHLMVMATQHTPVLRIPMRVLYLSIPFNTLFMSLYEGTYMLQNIRSALRPKFEAPVAKEVL
ncbi:MAG: TRAP transporter small permease [Clostridiales bacterium]|nr:TRAP transporter small permease [Clostridiales bacterium]